MNTIRRNLIANFAGQGWIALMGFVFVPFYIRLIGAEGYGLIGFFFLLSSALSVLNMGLHTTAMRHVAHFDEATDEEKSRIVLLLRSIEIFFWAIAILIGVVVGLAAPLLATRWLNVEASRIPQVTDGIRLMALSLAVQFPMEFYSSCLIGLQKQVRLNAITTAAATVRGVGALSVLWLIHPTIQAFFQWNAIVSFITVGLLRSSAWHVTGRRRTSEWLSLDALRDVGKYTAGVGGINLLGFLLVQIDKIVISAILPLRMFGYYTLAWNLGTFAQRFIGPIFNAYYPRIAQLVISAEPGQLAKPQQNSELVYFYLRASRVMAVAIVPFSIWLAFYARELLELWTRDAAIAGAASPAVSLIAIGIMLNGLMHIPYTVQLASGKLRLAFWHNLVSVFLVVPLTYYFATRFGITGAAIPALLLNLGALLIGAPLMYRRMMNGAGWAWCRSSVLVPSLQAFALVGALYVLSRQLHGTIQLTVVIGLSLAASLAAVGLSANLINTGKMMRRGKAYG